MSSNQRSHRRKRSRSRSHSHATSNAVGPSHARPSHHKGFRQFLPYIPILYWLPLYRVGWRDRLRGDLIASITVACMLIPQAMSYALLAGVPPIYGIYTASLPLFVYSILGTSRVQAVGPTAVDALLTYSTIASILTASELDVEQNRIELAVVLSLTSGCVLLLMGIFRLGVLVNFLSFSVMAGFTSGAAIIIILSQIRHLLGIQDVPSYVGAFARIRSFYYVVSHLHETNPWTLFISIVTIICLVLVKRWKRRRKAYLATRPSDAQPEPSYKRILGYAADLNALIATIITTLWTYIYKEIGVSVGENSGNNQYVDIIGEVPPGLKTPKAPELSKFSDRIGAIMFGSSVIALVAFMELYSIGTVYAERRRYKLDPNQELVSLGATNFFGGFVHAFPFGGSFSRTAVNADAGAKTLLANAITGLIAVITLIALSKLFFYIPMACLAAIIVVAVASLIKVDAFKMARKLHRKSDYYVMWLTFLITVIVSIQYGIAFGVFLSMLVTLNHSAFPRMPVLGQMPGTLQFRNVRNELNAKTYEHVTILRLDAELYFANTETFRKRIMQKGRSGSKAIIIDASIMTSIDLQGIIMLKALCTDLSKMRIQIYFANLRSSARKLFRRSGLNDVIGNGHIFIELSDAVLAGVHSVHTNTSIPQNMVSTSILMKSYEDNNIDTALGTDDDNEVISSSSSSSSSSSDSDSDDHSGNTLELKKVVETDDEVSPMISGLSMPTRLKSVEDGELELENI